MKTSFLNIKPTPPSGGHSSRRGSRRRAAAIPAVAEGTTDGEPLKKRCEIKYETSTIGDQENEDEGLGVDSANLLYIKSVQEVEEPKVSARLQAFIEPIWEVSVTQIRIIVPHIGIVCLSLLYIISGAATFHAIESPYEMASLYQNCLSIQNLTSDTLDILWNLISRKLATSGAVSFSSEKAIDTLDRTGHRLLNIFDHDPYIILDRIRDRMTQDLVCQNLPGQVVQEWTPSTALFFATTMLTTIGYGNLAPATPLGRVVCCIYGLLGIPLLLVTTANCGSFISDCLRMLHRKLYPRTVTQCQDLPQVMEPNEVTTLIDQPGEPSESGSEADDEPEEPVPASWVLSIILLYVVLGTFLLPLFEPWSYFESLYFCLITVTTIGYGDYVPLNRNYYFLTLAYILLGLALVTMSMELVAGQYIKKVHFFGRKIVLAKEALRNAKQLMKCMSLFGGSHQLRTDPIGFRTTRALSLVPELYIFHRLLVRSGAYTPADIDRILFIDQSVWDPYKNVAVRNEDDGHSSMIYMDDLAGLVVVEDLNEMKSEMDLPLLEHKIVRRKTKRRAKSWDDGKLWTGIVYADCRRNTI